MSYTPSEIIHLYKTAQKENRNLFETRVEEVKKNSNKRAQCSYYPLTIDGRPLKLKLVNQICYGTCKIPQESTSSVSNVTSLQLPFALLSKELMDATDYKKEDYKLLMDYNKELIEALHIIDSEYKKLCTEKLSDIDTSINSICQEKDKKGSKLENPIYRVKLPVNNNNLEIFNRNIVYKDGGSVLCNTDTAKEIFTRFSLINGYVLFDSICSSRQGLSLSNKVIKIASMTHKLIENDALEKPEFSFGTTVSMSNSYNTVVQSPFGHKTVLNLQETTPQTPRGVKKLQEAKKKSSIMFNDLSD